MSTGKIKYSTDLTNQQWQIIRPLLDLDYDGPGRPIEIDMREVVNASIYVAHTGCQWTDLPNDYPNHNTVYYHYNKWCKDGTWKQINTALRQQEREKRNRSADPTAGVMDSQSVETTFIGGEERGYDAAKNVKGRKRHIVVDTLGNVLEVVVHAANVQDYDGARALIRKLVEHIQSLKKLWADEIYKNGNLVQWIRDTFDIVLEIVERDPDQEGFEVLPRRWVVERTFAWLDLYRRLSKDYERTTRNSEGMIYIASIHTMLKRIAPAG